MEDSVQTSEKKRAEKNHDNYNVENEKRNFNSSWINKYICSEVIRTQSLIVHGSTNA